MGINARGDIVGSYGSADGRFHGFLLSEGRFTSIDVPGATFTFADGINSEGDIVGAYTTDPKLPATTYHGFLLREALSLLLISLAPVSLLPGESALAVTSWDGTTMPV
jgi:uncharacterized membrane protein